MAQAGGSATMYGVLYQIMGTLDWASHLHLIANRKGDDLVTAQLRIEPTGGGGDARIESHMHRVVGQWKAKSDQGTWSLQRMIDEVMPDLYLAINDDHLDNTSIYQFITEGHRGRWDAANAFFQGLARGMPPAEPLESLNGEESVQFFPSTRCTQRELFQHIVRAVRQRREVQHESEQLIYRKLWHLLARFEIKEGCTTVELRRKIDDIIYDLVDYQEDIDRKRYELEGFLLEAAARGNATFTPRELFDRAGLRAHSFRDWSGLQERLRQQLKDEFRRKKYEPVKDVRQTPLWPPPVPIVVLTGESGQGKTWQLCNVASVLQKKGELVVFVPTTGSTENDLNAAANRLWQDGLNHDGSLPLERLAQRRRTVVPDVPEPWLTICLDDVQLMEQARRVLRYGWEQWGIRLVITAPPSVAHALKSQDPDRVHVVEVPDFTVEELQEYLHRHGRAWGTIPQDVRTILRRPLLAQLYCGLTADPQWAPTHEYDLFARCWRQIRQARDQVDFPGDMEGMRRLALTLLEPTTVYPWSFSTLQAAGMDAAVSKRLEAIGWLRQVGDDQFEVWHDRLLNWALAEALVEQRRTKRMSTEELCPWLGKFQNLGEWLAGKSLSYVPMDVLWLACEGPSHVQTEVPQLIATLEEHEESSIFSLYQYLLPTIGARVLPALIARLRDTVDQSSFQQVALVTRAMLRIGRKEPAAVQSAALQLLDDSQQKLRRVGMQVLSRIPSTMALDRLWELHKEHLQQVQKQQGLQEKDGEPFFLQDLSFSALRTCVQLQPSWLAHKIYTTKPNKEPWSALAYLMANLSDPSLKTLWTEVKPLLFAEMPAVEPRSLINCIRHFRDTEELPRLEQWCLEEKDFASSAAFSALAILDPDRALTRLRGISHHELYFSRGWWLPELLTSRRVETQKALRTWMQDTPADIWRIADFYQGQENEMDAETATFLLDTLEQELHTQLSVLKASSKTPPWLSRHLQLVARLSRSELLQKFRLKIDSQLETLLSEAACAWVGRAGRSADPDLDHARSVLLKMGGSGITQLTNSALAHSEAFACLDGLEWALVNPNDQTRQLLRTLALENHYAETPSSVDQQAQAVCLLAALHETGAVIEAILRYGRSPSDLTDWLRDWGAISDQELALAIASLSSSDERVKIGAVLAIGYSMRPEFVPQIRDILKSVPADGPVALAAMIALDTVRDTTSETVQLLASQLKIADHRVCAMNSLLRIGTEEALEVLEHHVLALGPQTLRPLGDENFQLALVLAKRPVLRQSMVSMVWHAVRNIVELPWPSESFEVFGYLDDPAVRDWLREEAFPMEGAGHDIHRTMAVIRGLAKFDPDSAFDAAWLLLQNSSENREAVPELMMRLESAKAVPLLCDQVVGERHMLTRWAVGRAFRLAPQQDLVRDALLELLQSMDPVTRRTGAELCGWQRQHRFLGFLQSLVIDDPSEEVRSVARAALGRLSTEEEIVQLMEEFRPAESVQQWSLLRAIVEIGEPRLLGNRHDPLWIGQILNDAPMFFAKFAQKQLQKRIEETQKEASKADGGVG